MTLPTDSGSQGDSGVQGSPNPETSSPGGDQPNSAVQVDQLVSSLVSHPQFIAALERATQSTKDRRFARLDKKVKTFTEQLAEYNKLTQGGLSEDVATRLMEMGDQIQDLLPASPSAAAPVSGKSHGGAAVDFTVLLESLGLPENDPEVNAIIASGADYAQAVNVFAALAKSRKASQSITGGTNPPASPATAAPSVGGSPPPKPDLEAQYLAELKNIPQGNVRMIANLKQKYRKLGLQVS